jgi:hypothetical protein
MRLYIYTCQNQRAPLNYGKIVETLVEAKADLGALDKVSVLKEARLDVDRDMR